MKKYVMQAYDGKTYFVWVTTTKPLTGVVMTPWNDDGVLIELRYKSLKDAERVSSLLVKGVE